MHVPTLSLRTRARRIAATVLGLSMVLVVGLMPVAAFDPGDLFELEPSPPPRPIAGLRTTDHPATRASPHPGRRRHGGIRRVVATVQRRAARILRVRDRRRQSRADVQRERLPRRAARLGRSRCATSTSIPAIPVPTTRCSGRSASPSPVTCDRRDDDSHECAYLYGWNAAADGYARVLAAHVALGWADADADRVQTEGTWWLDVETANSWRIDRTLNVAALHGAVDFLESMDVEEVGFYSTPLLWWRVTRRHR